jgi:hypothetical protein
MKGKWTYNFGDSEIWTNDAEYDTKEAAIQGGTEEAKEEYDIGDSVNFFIGQMEEYIPYIDAECLIDSMSEDASSEVGEVADGWPNYKRADMDILKSRITEVVINWLNEIGEMPTFYKVINIENILVNL